MLLLGLQLTQLPGSSSWANMEGRMKLLTWRFDGSIGRHWSEDWSQVFRVGWFHVRNTWWPTLPTILEEGDLAATCSHEPGFRLNNVPVSVRYAKYMLKRLRPAEHEEVLTKRPRVGAEGQRMLSSCKPRPSAGTRRPPLEPTGWPQ